ncbi:hypothetical protein D3C85_1694150 [compost metagenome]
MHSTPSVPTSRMALICFSTPEANSFSERSWYRSLAPSRILPSPWRFFSMATRFSWARSEAMTTVNSFCTVSSVLVL